MLYLLYCILCLPSCFVYLLSFYPLSSSLYPVTCYLISCSLYLLACFLYLLSSILYLFVSIRILGLTRFVCKLNSLTLSPAAAMSWPARFLPSSSLLQSVIDCSNIYCFSPAPLFLSLSFSPPLCVCVCYWHCICKLSVNRSVGPYPSSPSRCPRLASPRLVLALCAAINLAVNRTCLNTSKLMSI